jgi:hypothetical protein
MFTDVLTLPEELNLTIPSTLEVEIEVIIAKTSLPIVLVPVLTAVAVTIGGYLNSDAKSIEKVFVVFPDTVSLVTISLYAAYTFALLFFTSSFPIPRVSTVV